MHETNPWIPQVLSFDIQDLSPLSRWGLTLSFSTWCITESQNHRI